MSCVHSRSGIGLCEMFIFIEIAVILLRALILPSALLLVISRIVKVEAILVIPLMFCKMLLLVISICNALLVVKFPRPSILNKLLL